MLYDAHGEVAVFGQRVGHKSARILYGFLSEGPYGARHHGDGVDVGVGHAVEVLAGGVLYGLPSGEHVALVAHLHIACHGPYASLLVGHEVLHEPCHGIGSQLCVGIYAHDEVGVGLPDTLVQGRCLASVGLGDDGYARVVGVGLAHHLQGVVLAAIVYHVDVQGRIVLRQQALDGAHYVHLLVVGRHYDGESRRVGLGYRLIVALRLTPLFAYHEHIHEG